MSKKMYFFDDEGDKWEIYDMEGMCNEFLDDDLIGVYKSTRYYHELEMAKLELIKLGYLEQIKGEEYDAVAVLAGADIMANEIVKRMGQEVLDIADSEVDVTWKLNKPDFTKYKK